MHAGAGKAAACCRCRTHKAGADTAKQVGIDQDLREVPVNSEARISDDRQKFPKPSWGDARTNLVRPLHGAANMPEPLAFGGCGSYFNLYRQIGHQVGNHLFIPGLDEDCHPPASVQRPLAQGKQLPEPGWIIFNVSQKEKIPQLG